ncbi:YifB family Mg chelatase-like AAA ATPase [Patescibacteria group bacterium]|nr:YifB family Mg chelatase-like AAA ATPase [Patescibacteria group bacterium]
MSSKIFSATTFGLDSQLIEVEADLIGEAAKFIIVGLPDLAIQEARERVRSAIKNSGLAFPRTKITVNLAPADFKKIGPGFDLPIALAVLIAKKSLILSPLDQQAVFVGELALNGDLRPINGVLSIALLVKEQKIKRLYLPKANASEANLIKGLEIYSLENLAQLLEHLKGKLLIKPLLGTDLQITATKNPAITFQKIKGQLQAKRALEICAAGNHNLLMNGPPGSGKTLLARSLAELLPPLTFEEALEVTKIYSVSGLLAQKQPLIMTRPFRSPHHTTSSIALVGGGSFPKPGEITLAHRGVLFLDELPEFPRTVLENLRQPVEDGVVTIARAAQTLQFPARFTLVAAANPCPCGYLTDAEKECKCTASQIFKYQKRISGPLLDRFDLQIEVPRLKFIDIGLTTTTSQIQYLLHNIHQARNLQLKRFKDNNLSNFYTNNEINSGNIEQLCPLDISGQQLLKQAMSKFHLSMRGYHKIIKVARTIADLATSKNIKTEHLAEALQFRIN